MKAQYNFRSGRVRAGPLPDDFEFGGGHGNGPKFKGSNGTIGKKLCFGIPINTISFVHLSTNDQIS